ncbi:MULTISPECIES: glycoside hydrolase family 2 protein [unclassified Micromonospora]|uniref:glycoside hydrolase family 2 protein n=1 Tax=unclassified Micromonospora TaxID=2617518 RepID=UPI003632F333
MPRPATRRKSQSRACRTGPAKDRLVLITTPACHGWQLRHAAGPRPDRASTARDAPIPAPVPGDVHMALESAGVIPDPMEDDNSDILGWIGESDWEYTTHVQPVPARERVDLVFEGVDTVAVLWVNGTRIATNTNMHRSWRVPVDFRAHRGMRLRLLLSSPVREAQDQRDRLGALPSAFSPLPPFIRKKACDFGWDWGPALTGAGIWRPVSVQAWDTARISALRPSAVLVGRDGRVDIDLEVERAPSGRGRTLTVEVTVAATTVTLTVPPEQDRVRGSVDVVEPELWWPAGMGPRHRYPVTAVLRHADTVLDTATRQVGFRTVRVEQEPDDAGGISFGFTVNDRPLFVTGANWIPDDVSIAKVDRARIHDRISAALAIGVNLVRVWGGGVFESDDFYDTCDELGMLVWQDFLFACAAYPEEPPFSAEVAAEARDNVTRLMPHPSLVLWNGNNENLWFWFLHDWEHVVGRRTWGEGLYFDLLPAVVADLDPYRTYLPGSPSSGDRWRDPNDPGAGVVHCWLPADYRAYDEVRPRFVSEFGFQGPPSRPTFDRVVHDERPHPFSPGVAQRQKAHGGTERINEVLAEHFGVPVDFDEWYWLAQLDQARAVRYGIERFRSLSPYCRGTIVWQLNDCWPAMSWSLLDYEGRWKPVAYAVREAYRDQAVILRHEAGGPRVSAYNETPHPWTVTVSVQRWSRRQRLGADEVLIECPANAAVSVPVPTSLLADHPLPADQALIATAADLRSVLLGATDRDFGAAVPRFAVTSTATVDGVRVEVSADVLVRDLFLAVDEIDPTAWASSNLVTLLPGETWSTRVRTADPAAFTVDALRSVLRWAHPATVADHTFRGLKDVSPA